MLVGDDVLPLVSTDQITNCSTKGTAKALHVLPWYMFTIRPERITVTDHDDNPDGYAMTTPSFRLKVFEQFVNIIIVQIDSYILFVSQRLNSICADRFEIIDIVGFPGAHVRFVVVFHP